MNGALSAMLGEERSKKTCIEFRCMTIIDSNLWRTKGLYKAPDEIENFIFLVFRQKIRKFRPEKLEIILL